MKIDPINGRLGKHRFHMMLVHFPTALYPFSLVMDVLGWYTMQPSFHQAGWYALVGGVTTGLLAMIYGAIDFLKMDPSSNAWKTAGIHALLNLIWFISFSLLLGYRWKYPENHPDPIYLILSLFSSIGLFTSNYFGAELVVKYGIGVEK